MNQMQRTTAQRTQPANVSNGKTIIYGKSSTATVLSENVSTANLNYAAVPSS